MPDGREEKSRRSGASWDSPGAGPSWSIASHRYEDFHLLMPLYVCRVWDGTPVALEGQELKWVRPGEMKNLAMPPADMPLVAMLRDFL